MRAPCSELFPREDTIFDRDPCDDARPVPLCNAVVRLRGTPGAGDGAPVGIRTIWLAKQGIQADDLWSVLPTGNFLRGSHGKGTR